MATRTIAFNGTTHTTTKAATLALREFVATIPQRIWLHPGDPRFEVLRGALENHYSWGDRLDEIVKLRFEPEIPTGTACRVILSDGRSDKVSWTRAFKPAPTAYGRVVAALRYEVGDQSRDYRDKITAGEIPATCALTRRPLEPGYEIDHYAPTFERLVAEWLDGQGGFDAIPVERIEGSGGWRIADDEIADDWWFYHRDHARLRAVNAEPHKRRTKRQAATR